jgi:uncharacterized membrane protein YuzA (DUF378 family)
MTDLTVVDWVAVVLVVVGALNWGLVGLAKFDLVETIFGEESPLARIVYILVGLAGVYVLYLATIVGRK